MELILAVKEIVKFLYSTGDLTNELISEDVGKEIHSYWQSLYRKDIDIKEYYVKEKINIDEYEITVHGFIDGILDNGLVLEEIKTTYIDPNKTEVKNEHLAQAKMYGYLYMLKTNMESLDIRLTYIHFNSKEPLSFVYNY